MNSTNQLTLNNIKGLVNNSQTASAICKRRRRGNKLHRRLNSTDQFINKTALADLHGGQNISESPQDPDFFFCNLVERFAASLSACAEYSNGLFPPTPGISD